MNDIKKGFIFALASYLMWGSLSLYWKSMDTVPALEILANRLCWSFLLLIIIGLFRNKEKLLEYFTNRKKRLSIILTGSLIAINWGVFIYAVTNDHVIEASLGYYINPIICFLFAAIILKEKLNLPKIISIVSASTGVVILTINFGSIPWIALILAVSFALYGLFKKIFGLDSLISLTGETFFLFPIALGYLIFLSVSGNQNIFAGNIRIDVLLILSGAATTIPLLLFAEGAKRIALTTIGFLQYLAPTIMLVAGVFLFKEDFSLIHAISFGFIWLGILIYTLSSLIGVSNRDSSSGSNSQIKS